MIGSGLDVIDGIGAMLSHDFIRNAFLAGSVIAVTAGLVGYFVVVRNQVFTGDAVSHVAFTGAVAAFVVGVDSTVGLYAATILSALVMGSLGGRARGRDVVIGVVFAWVLGLGVLLLTLYTTSRSSSNGAVGVNVLFGSIYGLSVRQAVVAACLGAATAVALLVMARPLLFASIDPDVAASRGLPVRGLGYAFLVLVGISVGEAVQAVGALLIVGLLVTPAATAVRLTARPYRAMALSGAIGLACLWLGLTLSYVFQRIPPSFLIIALAFAAYVGTVLTTTVRRRLSAARPAPTPLLEGG